MIIIPRIELEKDYPKLEDAPELDLNAPIEYSEPIEEQENDIY